MTIVLNGRFVTRSRVNMQLELFAHAERRGNQWRHVSVHHGRLL